MGNINATYLEVVNTALVALGENPKATWSYGSGADTVESLFDKRLAPVTKRVLRKYPWDSASTWKQFGTSDLGTLPTGASTFTTAYNLPSDFLFLNGKPYDSFGNYIEPEGEPPVWEISGALLLTIMIGINIKYIQFLEPDGATEPDWDSSLSEYLGLELANTLCMAITSDRQLKLAIQQDAHDAFLDATLANEQSQFGLFGQRGTVLRATHRPRGWPNG